MSKATFLADLYKQSVQEYTKNPAEWKGLLSCVARYYKRSFDNAVLVYAQRPGATQLATFDEWHDRRINRSINKGAKGIAVIDMANPKASLKYLFDFMDTNGDEQSFKRVLGYVWTLEEQYQHELLTKFHEKYGISASSMEVFLYKLVQRQIRESLPPQMENFRVRDESSMLYNLPIEAVKAELTEIITDSTAYTVFQKCGLSTDIFEENAFSNISHFNSLDLFMTIGSYTVAFARPLLREIHEEIQNIKNERSRSHENRAINEPELPSGRGRDDVSRTANIGEPNPRPVVGGEIRQDVEGLHDGTALPPPIGADRTGYNQSDNHHSGRRSGEPERGIDTGTTQRTTPPEHRGYTGESGPYGDDYSDSRRNYHQRSGTENEISLPAPQLNTPADNEVSAGVFLRSERNLPSYDEEELSDIVDLFLVADDTAPDSKDWLSSIHSFFMDQPYQLSDKAALVKACYGSYDDVYYCHTGINMEVKANSEGLTFDVYGQTISFTYSEIAEKIDTLIMTDVYPYNSEEFLDDYAIPDEVHEMQGVTENEPETPSLLIPTPSIIKEQIIEQVLMKGNITEGGKERIQNAILSMQAKSDRVSFIRSEYSYAGVSMGLDGGGHYRWNADGKGITIDYQDDTLAFTETLSWNRAEALIYELVKQEAYLLPQDISKENPSQSDNLSTEIENLVFEPYTDMESENESTFTVQPSGNQLSLFKTLEKPEQSYEITGGNDNDGMIADIIIAEGKTTSVEQDHSDTPYPTDEIQAIPITQPIQISTAHENSRNYHYSSDHNLYEGGPKTKCRNNIEAIQLLKRLQSEGRLATADEQIILAKFVGWGGLANALTPEKSGWENEFAEIKALLTEDEFRSAQESTTTAYFTEQSVIRHIYTALERFGFREGNMLDPAMGTGNFYSVLPDSMVDSKLYGVELDTITGGIAKQLYPDAHIEVKGFEEVNHPDHFFDVAIGNIPFNSIHVSDRRYDKHNFRIHDYFIAKTLDKVRGGGIIAFITSKYTLDKANPTIRKYMAQRAELIGAIRLPNNAFKAVAGTEATTDILFLQKRDSEVVPDGNDYPWIYTEENEDGIPMNSYFIDHPEMVLGEMAFDVSMFGNDKTTACHPREGDDLDKLLGNAVYYLDGQYREPSTDFESNKETLIRESIPADPNVKNYSYTLVDHDLYYRENSRMYRQNITGKKRERIEGLLELRFALRSLISFQTDPFHDEGDLPIMAYETRLQGYLDHLNECYDNFVKRNGYINSLGNVMAFSKDSDAPLLRSIEEQKEGEKGVFTKTAVFYKATIKPKIMPKSADSAEEALKISLNIKGRVDLTYMHWLYRRPDSTKPEIDEIITELGDRIYQDLDKYTGEPYAGWVTAEEYLSGDVKEKWSTALYKAEQYPELFTRNADALREVQPTPLTPNEISFTLGSTWIPVETYQQFMYERFKTSAYNRGGSNSIAIEFSEYSGAYHIDGKGWEKDSVAVNKTYGTERKNAYEILEDTLNLKTVTVKDRVDYVDPATGEDKVKYVLNKVETVLAREKQAHIKMEFESWLFADSQRGAALTDLYNDRFNNTRPRQYNGDDLLLPDLSDTIKLRKHQLDVIAHGIYSSGNLLAAHEVGSGKTMSGIVIGYELKRMGALHKPLITAPNHLVGQWASEYLRLYPSANILVAEKKDLEKHNRRRFVSRIATGEYDAIIMAHSSFELINLSREKQLSVLTREIDEITGAIANEKTIQGKNWSLKQMQIFQRNLQYRYDRLFKSEKKDDTINFEELGVDMLIVDEAHVYKNNFSYSKLRNVAGISSQSSQRAMDMHMKCQHINEINGGKGVVYLTGTPISNSMSELYVMQKTLQPHELQKRGLMMFDAWASTFGKIEASLEIRPEGNGYQMKNRFSRFHNLPELMSIFSMVADIKTAEMLPDLPVPNLTTGEVQVIKTGITPDQKAIVDELVMRAEDIREKRVTSDEDNFLKLTNEARLLAVDPRILDPTLPDDPNTKLNVCVRKVAEVYHETADKKLTQLIFCDKGIPKDDGSFDFYNATKAALIAQGVKPEEIAFIHEAKTDVQREQLFDKIRSGEIRILIGSTEKMGTGMNVQKKLIAVHHLDIPWRPADLIQRNGRILRQGNDNEEVGIYQYITEQTFDTYLFQILEQKQRYISQIMTGRSSLRSCEDIDETVLQYAEFKALAVADERIKEKMEVDNEISRLQILKSSWKSQQNDLQYKTGSYYPKEIESAKSRIEKHTADTAAFEQNKPVDFVITIDGRTHDERVRAGEHLKVMARKLGRDTGDTLVVGSYAGFAISLYRGWNNTVGIYLNGKASYSTDMGDSELGNITRLENLAERIHESKTDSERKLENLLVQLEQAKAEAAKPFPNEERLSELLIKKVELDLALEFKDDPQDDVLLNEDGEISPDTPQTKTVSPAATSLVHKNYMKLYALAPDILEGESYYMKFKSDGFEDLVLERIGGDEISIAHYYRQNGDSMRDPEITMLVDNENKTVTPTSFLQDDMGIFYTTDSVSPAKVQNLEQFISQWFTNIGDQGFEAVDVRYCDEDEEEDVDYEMER